MNPGRATFARLDNPTPRRSVALPPPAGIRALPEAGGPVLSVELGPPLSRLSVVGDRAGRDRPGHRRGDQYDRLALAARGGPGAECPDDPARPRQIVTMAAKGPFDLGNIHFTMVETTRPTGVDEVRKLLEAAPRVAFVRANEGIVVQELDRELMRDLGRPRADLWEVALWEHAIAVRPDGGEIDLVCHVPNEAIAIPDTIDAIRSRTVLEADAARSIGKTDASLGIRRRFLWSGASVGVGAG